MICCVKRRLIPSWRSRRKALKGRLEPLYDDGSTRVRLTALRQDAGLLVSTVIAIPFYLTHPNVMLDIPYILDSFHKLSRQYVSEPFLKQWIDMLAFFSGFPAEGTMGATMIYSIPGFHRPGRRCARRKAARRRLLINYSIVWRSLAVSCSLVSRRRSHRRGRRGRAAPERKIIKANHAVVSNATIWDTVPMLPGTEKLQEQGLDRRRVEGGNV